MPVLASGKIGSVPVYSYGSASAMVQGGQTIVNNMSPWMTGPQMNLTATNIPTSGVAFYTSPVLDSRVYGGIAAPKTAVNGTATAAVSVAPTAFTTERRVSVATSNSPQQGIARETNQFEASFDLSNLLPEIQGISVDDSDPTRPVFAVAGNLSAADVGLIFLDWTADQVQVQWRLIYPAGSANTVLFPAMPAELPSAPTQLDAARITVFDVTGSSYADVLTQGYHFYEYNHECPALPMGSECRFSNFDAL